MSNPFEALETEWDDETNRINQLIETAIAAQPPAYTQDPVVFREQSDGYNRSTRKECAEAVERTIAGDIAARVFVPPVVKSVYLYIHGGAWMMGARDLADEMMWARATRAETAVVSIDYRLAPEHRWPACAEDCEKAARWLVDNAVAEFGTDTLLIGGDSAGAHLSVVTLLALRDGHQTGFSGADLRYGMFDLRLTGGARLYEGVALEAKTLDWCLDLCFDPEVRDSAPASPILADLRGMPAALFTVGTNDSLLEDSLLMYARWRAAGNPAELIVFPGGMHAFDYAPTQAAAKALDDSIAFITNCQANRAL